MHALCIADPPQQPHSEPDGIKAHFFSRIQLVRGEISQLGLGTQGWHRIRYILLRFRNTFGTWGPHASGTGNGGGGLLIKKIFFRTYGFRKDLFLGGLGSV